MSYTDVFGGATIYPAGQTYLSLTFSTDQVLAWPIEQAVAGDNVVANIMDLNATVAGLNVDIPDARQVSNGIQSVFNNVGAETITIRDAGGGTIISLASGTAWVVYLTDNSTLAGTWRTFQLGASVSTAVAAALAGAGLKAIGSTLNQRIAPTSTAVTPITWVDSDRAQLTIWTGGVGVLNFPAPATVGSDWFSMVRNSGTGDLTLTPPSGTIDSASTLILAPGESAIIVTDGTNFFTIGLGQSTAGFFDFVEINVAGSGDFTLSGVQLNRISYRFTGVLTGDRNIVVPNTVQQYWVDNSTTGAFSLFVNTVAQVTPIEIQQGDRNILYCDGSDVVAAESATVSFPISVAQGGTGANNAATARTNLAVPPDTRNLTAGSGISGGGNLTADRTFQLDTGSSLNVDHAAVSVLAGTGLSGGGTIEADRTLNVTQATEGALGGAEIATVAEVQAGTDDNRIVTPLKLLSFAPRVFSAVATSTQSVSSNTTVQNDDTLFFTSLPIGIYRINALIIWSEDVATTQGIKWEFDISAGTATGNFMSLIPSTIVNTGTTIREGQHELGTDVETTTPAANNIDRLIQVTGFLNVTVAATFRFQFAQSVSDANATVREPGSWLVAEKLS